MNNRMRRLMEMMTGEPEEKAAMGEAEPFANMPGAADFQTIKKQADWWAKEYPKVRSKWAKGTDSISGNANIKIFDPIWKAFKHASRWL